MFGLKKVLKWAGYVPEKKSAMNWGNAASVISIDPFTSNLILNSSYQNLAKEGYIENVIANRCIRHTAECIAGIDFDIMINDKNADDSNDRLGQALKKIVKNPYPDCTWKDTVKKIYHHKAIDGNAYIYAPMENVGNMPSSLEVFRPDRVNVFESTDNRVHRYQYNNGDRIEIFTRDEDGYFDLIHIKSFNPVDDVRGLSPLIAAGLSIDSHTEANRYNKQIVKNGAKPSGMITVQDKDNSGMLDDDEIENLQRRIKEKLAKNNGGIFVSDMPAKFDAINFSNSEMDWLNGIKANAISICNALDYPPHLLGLESTTFNNAAEAKLELYENSVIPKTEDIYSSICDFYSRKTGQDVKFALNKKSILALAPRFMEISKEARENFKSGIISQNEARYQCGYDETSFGDDIFVDQNNQPMNQQLEG